MVSSSGIGPKSELNHRGTPQYVELPVGESLCDHVCIQTFWKIKNGNTLIGQVSRSEWMSLHGNEPVLLNDAHRLLHGDDLEKICCPRKLNLLQCKRLARAVRLFS